MTTNQLNSKTVEHAKPKEIDGVFKDKRYSDGGGLYLLVTAKGGKLWRYNFSFKNKKYTLSLGKFPSLSLADARVMHIDARNQIAKGINPLEEKRKQKALKNQLDQEKNHTFQKVLEIWLKKKKKEVVESTFIRMEKGIKRDFHPIMNKPMNKIEKRDLVKIVEAVGDRGAVETAHRHLGSANQIWKMAVSRDIVKHNIVADIDANDVLDPRTRNVNSYRTITEPQRIGELLKAIDTYRGGHTTRSLLKLLPHVAVRSQTIRLATWKEFDLKKGVWVVPSENLKLKKKYKGLRKYDLVLPLSPQAIEILKEIEPYTHDADYVFHSPLSKRKALTVEAIGQALKRLDFGEEITPHGVRHMFSTLANESGKFRNDVIESFLGHTDKDKVRATYNKATYEKEKRELANWWSEFLEGVKHG
jgi:integrase